MTFVPTDDTINIIDNHRKAKETDKVKIFKGKKGESLC